MTYSLIIFDCDGTLVDSEYLNTLAIVEILHECGLSDFTMERALEEFVGLRFSTIMANITKDTGFTFPEDAVSRYLNKVRALAPDHMKSIKGAKETILAAQKHAETCVVSNGERDNVLTSLEFTGLKDLFEEEFIITGLMAPNPKPAPDLFLLAAEKKNIPPSKCLVIEDSVTGAQAGVAAGMDVWGFTGTHHDPDTQDSRLKQLGVKACYQDMGALMNDLNKIQRA